MSHTKDYSRMSNEDLRFWAYTDMDAALELIHREQNHWSRMTDAQLKAAAKQIVADSSSVEEAKRLIREKLGYPYGIAIHSHVPNDRVGKEARLLVQALGGPTMRNGAMVMVMMHGHNGTISF